MKERSAKKYCESCRGLTMHRYLEPEPDCVLLLVASYKEIADACYYCTECLRASADLRRLKDLLRDKTDAIKKG